MPGPQLRRIYQLPSLTTPATQLTGAYMVWDVPLGPVVGGFKTMRGTPEELVEYLRAQGLLSVYNDQPSMRKAVEYRTVAEKTASPVSLPDSSTMEELKEISMCLGTEVYVANDPDGHHEYKVVYDFNGPLLVWVDGNFSQSPRGRIQASIVPNDSAGGSSPATYTATENVGGVHAGDSFTTADSAVVQMLITYQAPVFTAFAIDGQGSRTILLGTTFAANHSAAVSWNTSNYANVQANSLTLQDVTAGTTLASNEADDGTLTAALAGFTVGLGESRRYRLSGLNSKGNAFSSDIVLAGETQAYFGYRAAASLSPSQVVALGRAQIQGSRARSEAGVTATGGQYTYYAYDARHGDLTSVVMDGVVQVLGAFQKLGDVNTTNVAGGAVTVRVYRSNQVDAFSNNSLAFS